MAQRHDARAFNQLREVKVTYDIYTFGTSVLLEMGNTKVLCTVSICPGVPHFLRNKGSGWLTAEYALLPHATHTRTVRDSGINDKKINGRTVEISRLIGRVLRTVCNLKVLGENTVYVDCDVLQADGGTRTTAITAAWLALQRAQERWLEARQISCALIQEGVIGISVGVRDNHLLLDPDYQEDSTIDADFNIICTQSGKLIEIQGGAEKKAISWQLFEEIRVLAQQGIEQLLRLVKPTITLSKEVGVDKPVEKVPLFSLQNRTKLSLHQ